MFKRRFYEVFKKGTFAPPAPPNERQEGFLLPAALSLASL